MLKEYIKFIFVFLFFRLSSITRYLKKTTTLDDESLDYINESISNIGSSVFNWLHGNYKTSLVMLRLAIENFVRGIGSIEDRSLLTEDVVFKLFDKFKTLSIYINDNDQQTSFDKIHNEYKTLCQYVHTSSKTYNGKYRIFKDIS